MLGNKTIAVVVPSYNEEKQIQRVIDTMPDFVDRIVIVNDLSNDRTAEIVQRYVDSGEKSPIQLKNLQDSPIEFTGYNRAEVVLFEKNQQEISKHNPSVVYNKDVTNDRIILINHLKNGGVGASIASGYFWCKNYNIDCTAVMAGDGQMDPAELKSICQPVIDENIDYVKGNRLIHRSAWLVIPKTRFFGNSILSILTKIASGYWNVSDTQTGYTAISNSALNAIETHKIYKSYGMPNDMLVKLNIAMCTLREVQIKPVYDVGEQSKMKIFKVIPRVSWLLLTLFVKRLWVKYMFRDFHPLFILYNLSFALFFISIPYGISIVKNISVDGAITPNNILIIFVFLLISSWQFLLFAMWMDIQDNERLYK